MSGIEIVESPLLSEFQMETERDRERHLGRKVSLAVTGTFDRGRREGIFGKSDTLLCSFPSGLIVICDELCGSLSTCRTLILAESGRKMEDSGVSDGKTSGCPWKAR